MIASLSSEFIAHLWQSTLVCGVVWLMALLLRGNRARVRYWLWTAASVKFLVPFSWLVSLGAQFEWRTAPAIAPPAAKFVMEEILASPVVATAASTTTAQPTVVWPFWVLASVWAVGFLVVLFWWWRQWRPVKAALRQAKAVELECTQDFPDITVMSSPWTFEPGVVGIWRPVLLLPDGLKDQLTSAQMKAVIAHERCHIRSRDNLAAAVHMLVEAIFWFHPLVWWIGGRLVDERERACDEAVLRAGNDPTAYVEGILTVCRYTLRAPIACVAGVSGAELRTRIESIVRMELGARMTLTRRVAIAVVVGALLGVPTVSGLLRTPLLPVAQQPSKPVFFEVAAVRQNNSGQNGFTTDDELPGGRYTATNAPLRHLIREAFGVSEIQLVDAPAWTRTERFDIDAKLEREPPIVPDGELGERNFALQSLLAKRFKLVVHRETREAPLYAFVMAKPDRKPGPMLKQSVADCSPEAMPARIAATREGGALTCGALVNDGRIRFGGRTMSQLAKTFSSLPYIGRGVVDRTGLTGKWQFELTYTPAPDQLPPLRPGQDPPAFDPNGPSLFVALQEQLGLKLESIRGPMEFLVVDGVEKLNEQDAFNPQR
jgi:bla regulator protein BlaR1